MDKTHILKIIDILYNDCISAGGDGDAIWYVTFYELEDILVILEEYNKSLKYQFDIQLQDSSTIYWGRNQGWIIITKNKEVWDSAPSWSQLLLKT